jgi:predicted esterase
MVSQVGFGATVDDFLPVRYTNSPTQILPARLWTPRNPLPDQKYPLVLFLHGAGERGTDNRLQLDGQAAQLVFVEPHNQARWPCFMLAPQCPPGLTWAGMNAGDTWSDPDGTGDFTAQPTWPLASVMALLAQLTNSGPYAAQIDVSRLFVTGLSMGGFGTWEAISRWPGVFRGAVPICGGGDPRKVSSIGSVPVWAFHAEDDGVVLVGRSRQMILSLRALGQPVRYTEFPASLGVGHGSWIPAYGDGGLLPWLFGDPGSLGGDGLYTEYFATTNWTGAVRTRRVEPAPDLNWGTSAPAGVPADRFSARLQAYWVVPETGRYTFRASADDRLSVWIDDQPLITSELVMTNGIVASRELTAGRHVLRFEYAELTGRAWMRLEAGLEDQPLRPLAMDSLFSGVQRVEAPTFDPPAGSYAGAQWVSLACATPGALIRYTTNGMAPGSQSTRYTGPVWVAAPGLLRAAATLAGSTNSQLVSADYQIYPAILTSPTNRVLAPGTSGSFSVMAVGKGALRYQWYREGAALLDETNASLTFSQAQVAWSGSYSVAVTDDFASVTSSPAALFVGLKPTFLVRPQNSSALLGDSASFSAEVTGTPPFLFNWRRNGRPFTNLLRAANFCILSIPVVDNTHLASYTVTVTNLAGTSLASPAVRLSGLADVDNDRLPDAWETEYGLNPGVPSELTVDSDGDGRTDRDEYLAGTHPRERTDFLTLQATSAVGDQLELSFAMSSNRTYRIVHAMALGAADWNSLVDVPASLSNRWASILVPVENGLTNSYYRLVTPAPSGS